MVLSLLLGNVDDNDNSNNNFIFSNHECSTNWGDCKSNKSKQMLVFEERENQSSQRKTSQSRVGNQQTQPTYDAGSGNRTRNTLVGGERTHNCTIPALEYLKGSCENTIGTLCDYCSLNEKCCPGINHVPRPFPDYESTGLYYLPMNDSNGRQDNW